MNQSMQGRNQIVHVYHISNQNYSFNTSFLTVLLYMYLLQMKFKVCIGTKVIVPLLEILHHSMDFPLSFGKMEELCIINIIGWISCNLKL